MSKRSHPVPGAFFSSNCCRASSFSTALTEFPNFIDRDPYLIGRDFPVFRPMPDVLALDMITDWFNGFGQHGVDSKKCKRRILKAVPTRRLGSGTAWSARLGSRYSSGHLMVNNVGLRTQVN